MSTHNICFYRKIWKIVGKLLSNTHLLCLSAVINGRVWIKFMLTVFLSDLSTQSTNQRSIMVISTIKPISQRQSNTTDPSMYQKGRMHVFSSITRRKTHLCKRYSINEDLYWQSLAHSLAKHLEKN